MDLAEYRTLFVLSFTTPAFDSDVAPSFGTLLATINVALSMLGEVVYSNQLQYIRYLSPIWFLPHKVNIRYCLKHAHARFQLPCDIAVNIKNYTNNKTTEMEHIQGIDLKMITFTLAPCCNTLNRTLFKFIV